MKNLFKVLILATVVVPYSTFAVTIIQVPEDTSFVSKVISAIETCKLDLRCYFNPPKRLGVSLTTITATTTLTSYPAIANANNNALNAGKIENSTTSLQSLVSAQHFHQRVGAASRGGARHRENRALVIHPSRLAVRQQWQFRSRGQTGPGRTARAGSLSRVRQHKLF